MRSLLITWMSSSSLMDHHFAWDGRLPKGSISSRLSADAILWRSSEMSLYVEVYRWTYLAQGPMAIPMGIGQYFFLEVQVYMIKCNHYKPSLCAQSSVMEDEWKRDEQTNKTNKQTKQEQSTGKRSVGRMDDEGCRTWWCIDSWHGRSRFHENANFSKMTSENLRNKGAHLCPN